MSGRKLKKKRNDDVELVWLGKFVGQNLPEMMIPDGVTIVDITLEPLQHRYCAMAQVVENGGRYMACETCKQVYILPPGAMQEALDAVSISHDGEVQLYYHVPTCMKCDFHRFEAYYPMLLVDGWSFEEGENFDGCKDCDHAECGTH